MRKVVLAILFIGLLSYNLYPTPLSTFDKAKNEVLERQDDANAKENLAKIYLENNDWTTAEEIVNRIIRNSEQSQEIKNKIEFQKNEPERIKNEIIKWDKIVFDYPNFRDGFLKLAVLNWQIYNQDLSRWYWQKAFELDPNGVKTQQVGLALELNQ